MDNIVLAVGMLAAFLLGSWITYRAMIHKNPVMFIPKEEEPGDIISPYEEEKKNRVERVKI